MWFWYALASAVVSGVSVTFNKRVLNRGVRSSVVSLALFTVITLISIPLMLSQENTKVDYTFFLASLLSAVVFSVSKTLSLNIFKSNNLSDIYPLASIAPVTLYVLSVIFLSEHVKFIGVIGIFFMAAGVYLLNYKRGNKDIFHPLTHFFSNKYSVLYLGAIILGNISAIAEKIAIKHTLPNGVYHLAFWENLFLTIIIGGYVIKTNRNWFNEIRAHFLHLIIAASIYSGLYLLVITGFKDGPVSLVSAIKKLEVLVVLIISFLLFNDKPARKVFVATFIMLLAVLLIKL